MIIRIKNLRLRTIIGINEWEREHFQDITLNVKIEFDGSRVVESDDIKDTVDYKALKKRIIQEVEQSQFSLVEKLAGHILQIIMEDEKVIFAEVEVDKPHALRFADSVSLTCSSRREK